MRPPRHHVQTGLQLGVPYTVNNYPTGNNPANKTFPGRHPRSHRPLGITSTVSGSGDQGADPNRLIDDIDNTDATVAAKENFFVVREAGFAEVLRGVAFAPTGKDNDGHGHGDQDDDHGDR